MIARMKAQGVCCSFCGKSRGEVSDIVAGAPHTATGRRARKKSSFICNECVRRFRHLLANSEVNDTLVPTSNLN